MNNTATATAKETVRRPAPAAPSSAGRMTRRVEPALQLVRETLELTEADILLPFSAEKGMGKEDLIRLLVQTCGG